MEEEKDKKGLTGRDVGSKTIPILGELESRTKEGITVAAGTVYDYAKEKFQQTINEEVDTRITSLENTYDESIVPELAEVKEGLANVNPYLIVYENQHVNIDCNAYGDYRGSEDSISTIVKLYKGNAIEELDETNAIVIDYESSDETSTILGEFNPNDRTYGIISILTNKVSELDDITEINFHLTSVSGAVVYGKVFFNKVKQAKSAFEEWKDLMEDATLNINQFIAYLKNTDNIKGPKYLESETQKNNISPNDSTLNTIYFVPQDNGTEYKIYLLDAEDSQWKELATRPGNITNYAGIYDVSEDNLDNNNQPTKYSLSEAIDDIVAKGVGVPGMTIKYIDSNTNRYVQYRYLLSSTTNADFTNTDNWQGVDDTITEESENLATSKAVTKYVNDSLYGSIEDITSLIGSGNVNCWIDGSGNWYLNHGQKGGLLACNSLWLGNKITILGPSSQYAAKIAFLKSNTISNGNPADYCDGESNRHDIAAGTSETFTIPTDCAYLYFGIEATAMENAYRPRKVTISYDDNGIIPQIERRIDALELSERENTVDIDIDLSECKDENWYYYISEGNEYVKTAADETNGNTGVFYPLRYKAKKLYVEGTDILTSKVAFLKSQRGDEPDFCEGETRHTIAKGASETFDIPNDCNYIWFAIGQRANRTSYNENSYRPKKVTLLDVTLENNKLDVPNDNRTYSVKNDLLNPLNNVFGIFDYIRCESQEAIPVGSSAVSYANFIAEWDSFTSQHPEFSGKQEIIKSTTGDYSIYKYVYAPPYYEKTIFLTAGMHGNEYEGFWGLLRCMQYILENGNKNDIIGYIRHRCRIIIIPVLNPYGVENGIRYSTNNAVDQNYNFDVAWGKLCNPNTTTNYVIGTEPFEYNEPKAVKLVCDDYEGEILFHIDFHTDPFNANHTNNSKCNYIEADEDSIIFHAAYRLTLDEREHIKNDIGYQNPASDFVVWTNKAATSFRYMEWVRHIPSIIVETTTRKSSSDANGFAGASGSAAVMKATVDWYLNCICMMLTTVL